MTHLDDGTLQAFLDDELPPEDRAATAEHLLACPDCRAGQDELARANAVFSEAVAILDHEAPQSEAPRTSRSAGWGLGGPFIKAASLTLLVAAAASAAVPGSPVRAWIVKTVESEPVAEAGPMEAAPTEATPAAAPIPAGISLPVGSAVDIVVSELEGTTLRLVETDGDGVGIWALGAEQDPVFTTTPGRVDVRGAVGGEITVELPRGLDTARLLVDGTVYAEKASGTLQVHVQAATVDGARVWQ